VLLENCTLSSYDSTGKVVFSTSLPQFSEAAGPCQLIMDRNGTLYIRDIGNDGAVVWSNEVQTNRTAATCSPYSLSVLANGVLVERDCANKTVWVVPQLAGEQGPGMLRATRALLCLAWVAPCLLWLAVTFSCNKHRTGDRSHTK
jgi:hypothetical protein